MLANATPLHASALQYSTIFRQLKMFGNILGMGNVCLGNMKLPLDKRIYHSRKHMNGKRKVKGVDEARTDKWSRREDILE